MPRKNNSFPMDPSLGPSPVLRTLVVIMTDFFFFWIMEDIKKLDRRYDLLEIIAPPKECWKIHVRINRLWSLPKFKNPKSNSSIEMVLMDEQFYAYLGTIQLKTEQE
ncbi:hypothetical protein Ahy_B07g086346 [Arachis hypogaea]|uniref:DUF223 domain-containing protein n=1 Tax=Arachis hypogaea TaxID=3818 RepID=A0A444Y9I9_ARAHY|nr:hypothetical protein Ahy_B07g086346 [Arachis hypogaea]